MSKFGFSLDMFGFESKIRGLYLTVACDYEFFMVRIIAMCQVQDITKREAFKLSLPYEMGAKLKILKESVENYNINYYAFFKTHFDIISELVFYRTMLAHGFSQYDDNKVDESFIDFSWIEGPKNNRLKRTERIVIKSFLMDIDRYRLNLLEFMKLDAVLVNERGESQNI
jgi:hypothetical protein